MNSLLEINSEKTQNFSAYKRVDYTKENYSESFPQTDSW